MTITDLFHLFCAEGTSPFRQGNFAYATNREVAIRTYDTAAFTTLAPAPEMPLMDRFFQTRPRLHGVVRLYREMLAPYVAADSSSEVRVDVLVEIKGVFIQGRYAELLLDACDVQDLPYSRIVLTGLGGKTAPIVFEIGDFDVCIMPINVPDKGDFIIIYT
jgi:hypothetical protein